MMNDYGCKKILLSTSGPKRHTVILMIHSHVLRYQWNESDFDKFQSFDKTDTVSLLDSRESWPRRVSVLNWLPIVATRKQASKCFQETSHHVGSVILRSSYDLDSVAVKQLHNHKLYFNAVAALDTLLWLEHWCISLSRRIHKACKTLTSC